MRIRWRGLELPSRVACEESSATDHYSKFTIEPFERGFGTTIGNSLRRILLSSLEGAAVTRVKIAGAAHEFTSLPGVLEDVTDIVLNIKGLAIRTGSEGSVMIRVARSTKGEVKGRDIETDGDVQIINGEQHLATLTDDVEFSIEMAVEKGRGWRASEENLKGESDVLVFPVDSSFSPVTRVRYKAEDTRVGQRTNYDRLILEIWTNGTITPEDALVESAKILRKHLNPFVHYGELGTEQVSEALPGTASFDSPLDADLQAKLNMPLSELELSVRASNCLESARILTVGDLARCTESDLLRVRSFGKTSLREVKRKLAEFGLSLGMGSNEGRPVAGAVEQDASAPVQSLTVESILPPPPTMAGSQQSVPPSPLMDRDPFGVGR